MTELAFAPAVEQARLVREREVSPVELVELYLERIDKLDGELNSVVTLDADRALDAARAGEAQAGDEGAPPYLGVPILVKDLHLTAGLRTTFGCRLFAEFVPPVDEENVARIRRAGFIVLGKTNVPEFGPVPWTESELLGPCRNPWDTARTPGGSSGGAAAAMAAGLTPVAHGSDGGGSVRIPASNCGLVGLKPSRGRVSAGPLFGEMAQGLATVGPIARWTEDAAALLDVMAGYASGDPYWLPDPPRPFVEEARTDPSRLRVGVVRDPPFSTFGPEALAAVDAAAELLTSLGHEVDEMSFPDTGPSLKADFELVWAVGIAALPVPHDELEPFNAALARMGAGRSAPDLARARSSLHLHARQIVAATSVFDVVVGPTLAEPPLRVGELAGLTEAGPMLDRLAQYVGITPYPNFTGQPAVSLPLHWSGGLPIGVTAIGRPADEATLLQLAGQLERATAWPDRRPPVS